MKFHKGRNSRVYSVFIITLINYGPLNQRRESLQPQLLNTVGVRKTIRLLTVMPGLLIICTFLWRPLRSPRHTELDHYLILSRRSTVIEVVTGYKHYISKFLNLRIFRNRNYVVWVAGVTIICLGYAGPYVHMVSDADTSADQCFRGYVTVASSAERS